MSLSFSKLRQNKKSIFNADNSKENETKKLKLAFIYQRLS